jgi:hypothetical protein
MVWRKECEGETRAGERRTPGAGGQREAVVGEGWPGGERVARDRRPAVDVAKDFLYDVIVLG